MTRRALWILMGLLLIVLAGCGGSSNLVFDNLTVCGTIQIDLTNTQTNTTETYQVDSGQTLSVEVSPNIAYNYVVDYSAGGATADGFECIAVHRGQVSVPAGATQTFNLTAVTPTPSS